MARNLASINIRFAVNLSELSTQLQNSVRGFEKAGKQFQKAGENMSKYVTAPILGIGVASLKTFGDLEALQKGLISVMGSAEAAAAEFEKLKEVAKLPGLGLEEAVRGSVSLQAAGFSADEARAAMLAFGNALATVGKGARELDLVTLALTQLNNKASGFGQDLRQLMEQLPQLRGALTAAFGTADSEAIGKMGVTGRQVVQLLTKEFGKLPKVTGGFKNDIENTTDNIKIRFSQLGESIYKSLNISGALESFNESLSQITESFKALDPSVQKAILAITALTAAAGPFLFTIGGVLKALPVIVTGFAAVSAAALPVIAGAAALFLAYQALTSKTKELTASQYRAAAEQKTLNELTTQATQLIASQRLRLDQLVLTARSERESLENRKKAIAEINKISPEYLGNITLETVKTDAATMAINRYNESLFKGALARAARSKIDENAAKRVSAQLQYEKQTYEYNKQKNAAIAQGHTEAQKFYKEEGGAQGRAYLRYQDLLQSLDQQDAQLLKIYDSNKSYLELVKDIGSASAANIDLEKGAREGTIKFYEEQIKKLKELQEEFETTPEGVAILEDRIGALQKKIDALRGVRVKVTSVFESVNAPQQESQGTLEAYDRDIAKLRELQTQVGVTSDMFYDLETAIAQIELEKAIKFDFPLDEISNFNSEVTNFGDNFKLKFDEMQAKAQQAAAVMQGVAMGISDAFSGMANRFLDSLGLANDGLQGFFKGLSAVVIKIISAMLAQSISQAIAGATAAGAATGPASIFTTPAFIAEMVGGVLAAFAAIPKFATGGVVDGNSFYGDKILARVNSGELILNTDQQQALWRQLSSPKMPEIGMGSDFMKNMWQYINPAGTDVNVGLNGEFVLHGQDLKLSLNRVDKRDNRTT